MEVLLWIDWDESRDNCTLGAEFNVNDDEEFCRLVEELDKMTAKELHSKFIPGHGHEGHYHLVITEEEELGGMA